MNTAHAHPIPTKTGNLHAVVADRLSFIARSARIPRTPYKKTGNLHAVVAGRLSFIARSARIPRNPYKKTGNLHAVVAGRLNFIAPRAMTFYFIASSTATAAVTVAPTMGLLPMPKKPIIST